MKPPFEIVNVLTPTDMAAASVPTLRYAGMFAERLGAKLTVMHSEPIGYPLDDLGPAPALESAEADGGVSAALQKYVQSALGQQPVQLHIASGLPIPAILEFAKKSGVDLIVVGTHVHDNLNRVLLGSVKDGVLYGADCSVLVVPEDGTLAAHSECIETIVCPANLTDLAREALCAAACVARAFDANLLVVRAIEREFEQRIDERAVQSWIRKEFDVRCSYRELLIRGGSPADRVLDCAEDARADLIVLGAQHKLLHSAAVIGTSADRVMRFASCPVLVVPRQAVAVDDQWGERQAALLDDAAIRS